MIHPRPAALSIALLFCAGAHGQALPPIAFQPPAPTTSDPISIGFYKSPCVLTVDLPSEIDVNRTGGQVDVVIDGTVVYNEVFCVFSSGDVTLPIGRLPVGHYSVRVIVRDIVPPFLLFPPIAAGGIDVTPAIVPTLTTQNVAVLALAMLVAGWWAKRWRSTRRSALR